MPRARSCLVLLVAAAASSAGCAATYPVPPAHPLDGMAVRRLDRVDENVYRGGQPDPERFRELVERYGIRTVVKLDSDGEGRDDLPPGVRLVRDPLPVIFTPSDEQIEAALRAIEEGPKPVYIHCKHGEDRTGLVVALYRLRHGATVEQAWADMLSHGFHPYRGLVRAWQRATARK